MMPCIAPGGETGEELRGGEKARRIRAAALARAGKSERYAPLITVPAFHDRYIKNCSFDNYQI
ncbi:hypothetical protein KCP69_25535 [Salmonella enterica subsp. enterica]|nr:hypothetical protein KCP69_25535 [Salmonella enterica subsp. enterica]